MPTGPPIVKAGGRGNALNRRAGGSMGAASAARILGR